MCLYVHLYVRMHVRTHVCMYACMYMYMYMYLYLYMHMYMYMYACDACIHMSSNLPPQNTETAPTVVCRRTHWGKCTCKHISTYYLGHMHTYLQTNDQKKNIYIYTLQKIQNIQAYIHAPVNPCHAYKYTCIHTYIHTYIHAYTHTYIHTCIHTYIHTCIHTYTHTYRPTCIHVHTHTHMCMHA